jgi:uncharacterized protein (DUF433 family)
MIFMTEIVRSDKQILGGTPCFAGTRVPVKSLFDYLEDGCTVDYFLAQFPTVKREQVIALLESVRQKAESDALALSRS